MKTLTLRLSRCTCSDSASLSSLNMTSFVIGNKQLCSYRALKRLNNASGVSLSQCMLIVSVFE